ncbi:hypothetical protein [Actinophytocola sediminis]
MSNSKVPALLLSALRAAGGGAIIAPSVGAKVFGIKDDGEGKYLVRLFAARNVAFIAGLLLSKGKARRLWYQAGIACDALDVGAGLIAYREGKPPKSATVDTGIALVATLLGVAGVVADRKRGAVASDE